MSNNHTYCVPCAQCSLLLNQNAKYYAIQECNQLRQEIHQRLLLLENHVTLYLRNALSKCTTSVNSLSTAPLSKNEGQLKQISENTENVMIQKRHNPISNLKKILKNARNDDDDEISYQSPKKVKLAFTADNVQHQQSNVIQASLPQMDTTTQEVANILVLLEKGSSQNNSSNSNMLKVNADHTEIIKASTVQEETTEVFADFVVPKTTKFNIPMLSSVPIISLKIWLIPEPKNYYNNINYKKTMDMKSYEMITSMFMTPEEKPKHYDSYPSDGVLIALSGKWVDRKLINLHIGQTKVFDMNTWRGWDHLIQHQHVKELPETDLLIHEKQAGLFMERKAGKVNGSSIYRVKFNKETQIINVE